jgi:dihydrofolate reductase
MSAARPPLVVIAAVARNHVIGRDGALPCHIPRDMARLKALTTGSPVIMGRRTWDSLPPRVRPLPGRSNIVVTRQTQWSAPGAIAMPSLDAATRHAVGLCAEGRRIFVLGGAELYAQALPLADELELTEVQLDAIGDTHLPVWRREDFIEVRREPHAAAPGHPAFDFVTYHRKPR